MAKARMAKGSKQIFGDTPCIAAAIRKASRRLSQLYDDALGPSGLRSTQYSILFELDRRAKKPPTMRELADVLVIDRSALGHNLRPLQRDGLIALKGSSEDRRRRHVVITAQGKARYRKATPLWETAQHRFDQVYGKSKAEDLRATLSAIAHHDRLRTLRD
jgi:DNA-binding MarR family transcriptional regulator